MSKVKKLTKSIFLTSLSVFMLACNVQTEVIDSSSTKDDISIKITSLVDKPLNNVTVNVLDINQNIIESNKTNEDGITVLSSIDSEVNIKLEDLPLGYVQKDDYVINSSSDGVTFKVPTEVINKDIPNSKQYEIGDVAYDFDIVDSDGYKHNLIETLKQKDMVMINFWATWCEPCYREFPYLEEAYELYKSDVEIFALSNSDDIRDIISYKKTNELSFPMAYDDNDLAYHFNATQFPTSIIIDRYGMITTIEVGYFSSTEDIVTIFDRFVGEGYTPILANENGDFVDTPDIEMLDSSEYERVVSGEGFNSSFYNETNPEDAPYNWPWIISEDGKSMKPSNYRHGNSYSIIYTTIKLDNNHVFAFDYYADTEPYGDFLYVLIDKKIVQTITGKSDNWETCFAYIPQDELTHEVAFCYMKDQAGNSEKDTVYVNNLRIISTDRIDQPTLIYFDAFSKYNEETQDYEQYVNYVFNPHDGYYHVDSQNGTYLLANVQNNSVLSRVSLYETMGFGNASEMDPKYAKSLAKYCNLIAKYAELQNNSEIGLVPVTEELKVALQEIVKVVFKQDDNGWLKLCGYAKAFAREDISDPIKGLAPFSAFEGHLGENYVTFNRLLMPRGLYTSFTPSESGVYTFFSFSPNDDYIYETECWLMDANSRILEHSDFGERYYMMCDEPDPNASIYHYLEKGETYYICFAFANLNVFGDLPFVIEYLGVDEYTILTLASPNIFTTTLDENGEMTQNVIAGGVDVIMQDDGYYHVLNEDKTVGSILYADFLYSTGLFSDNASNPLSLLDMIEMNAFDFSYNELGESISGTDRSKEARDYASRAYVEGELIGLVPVDEGLANLLQALMDKYTFKDVPHSWTKLCYYFKTFSK